MESRETMISKSIQTKNKKLAQIFEHRDVFIEAVKKLSDESIVKNKSFHESTDAALVEGRDISVCVRVRPLMEYEITSGSFSTIVADHPFVHVMEPRLDFTGQPKPIINKTEVDFVFGPEHDNNDVYDAVMLPMVRLGLKGGVCTTLAYGQTGSGKTFTISGILDRIGFDLFRERNPEVIQLHLSMFELLGDKASNLLGASRGEGVDILEDKFGGINTRGAEEIEINSAEHFVELVHEGLSHRRTEATFKNDTSSRSHAIVAIRVVNTVLKEAEDGRIFIVDLAGSENAADAQFHDRSRIKETQQINKSLMSLKDCIRNRALSALNPDKFYHIPYRQSKLTLLMKSAFELESHRHCKTVVFANVSPTVNDVAMTNNTLRFATPLKIGQSHRQKVEPHPDNPAGWSNATLREWVAKQSNGKIDPEVLCPFESGMQLLRLPETEFLDRVITGSHPPVGAKKAKVFYTSLWKLLIDARTRERKAKLKPQSCSTFKEKYAKLSAEHYEELVRRCEIEEASEMDVESGSKTTWHISSK